MNTEAKSLADIQQKPAGDEAHQAMMRRRSEAERTISMISPFSSIATFEAAQRMARILTGSQLVPKRFQGEDALGDCVIALGMANRIGADPVMVMQNLYVVHGQPAWSGQFVIAAINQSGRFAEPLHFVEVGEKGTDEWGFYAETTSKIGNKIKGPTITIALAKAEGWFKSNPKWQSIPEMMLRYRAGSWFGRTECPELLMGFNTREEVIDAIDIDPETGEVLNAPGEDKATPISKVVDMAADAVVEAGSKVETVPRPKAEQEPEPEKKPEPEPEKKPEPEPEVKPPVEKSSSDGKDRLEQLAEHGYYQEGSRFFNAKGDLWNPDIHATAKATGGPVMNADGSFRARRGTAKSEPETPEPAAKKGLDDPIPDTADNQGQKAPDDDGGAWE